MSQKKGLGKGLGALFAEYDSVPDTHDNEYNREFAPTMPKNEGAQSHAHGAQGSAPELMNEHAREIPIYKLIPNLNQPRKNFDQEALKELAQSITRHGVIQPIIVCKQGDNFMIIAGERRFRAAKLAGLTEVPCIVKSLTSREIKEIALIENLQREDLNPIEAALGIRNLMEAHAYTQEEVAECLGKSRSAVANTLRLLSLAAEVIVLIQRGQLSAGHARCLVVLTQHADQIRFAHAASDNKMTVRQLEKAVKAFLNPKKVATVKQSIELKDLIERMQRTFATKVSALGNENKGRIYIDYYTRDDLDRISVLLEEFDKIARNMEDDN